MISFSVQNSDTSNTNLKKDNLTVREYSNMLLTKDFYNNIEGEKILLFQEQSK